MGCTKGVESTTATTMAFDFCNASKKFKVLTQTNSENVVNTKRNGLGTYIIQFQNEVN